MTYRENMNTELVLKTPKFNIFCKLFGHKPKITHDETANIYWLDTCCVVYDCVDEAYYKIAEKTTCLRCNQIYYTAHFERLVYYKKTNKFGYRVFYSLSKEDEQILYNNSVELTSFSEIKEFLETNGFQKKKRPWRSYDIIYVMLKNKEHFKICKNTFLLKKRSDFNV